VVKPVYTEAEQVIFTEQVRQIKAANWFFATIGLRLKRRPNEVVFFFIQQFLRFFSMLKLP
jgi:hypothetical protein